jgi:16S rRNA processing protein RimM
VVGLIETCPHCVLRIQPADAQADEVLIPFVDAYVDGVDLAAKRISVDWDFEPDADAN